MFVLKERAMTTAGTFIDSIISCSPTSLVATTTNATVDPCTIALVKITSPSIRVSVVVFSIYSICSHSSDKIQVLL